MLMPCGSGSGSVAASMLITLGGCSCYQQGTAAQQGVLSAPSAAALQRLLPGRALPPLILDYRLMYGSLPRATGQCPCSPSPLLHLPPPLCPPPPPAQVKHPGVIKVIEPLEETAGQMVMVTEPVFGSLANLTSNFREVPTAPQERATASLSPLEAKYGLHSLAETLHFLHHEAHLVHCNINPGAWDGLGGG